MSLTNNGDFTMPVMPMGNGYGNGGFGNDGMWWFIILLFALGWGGNGFGGGYGNNAGVPFIANDVQTGFDQAAVMGGINGITSGLANGFADIQQALCNGFAGVEQGANARQIANMQQGFATQTAITGGMNDIASQLAQCCCNQSMNTADLKYTVATEACADRSAISNALRDVLEANNASTQKILDTMCQDKIDAKNERIAELQNQLTMAQLAASQNAQTAAILTDNLAQTNALEQYLAPVPRPAYIVQNPNCCAQNYGCGCGVA